MGAFSANILIGISATLFLSKNNSIFFVSVVFPMTAKSKFHLSKIFLASASFPFYKTINILSWLSESIIS